jgi:two-component system response regulator HupR/HoxA
VHVVGEAQPRKVDVRVVAATNKDLQALIKEGRFREDLYYRLQSIEICLPPLRARPDDIPLLAAHFLRTECRKEKHAIPKINPAVLEALVRHNWPGNVRELQSEILQMVHRLTDEPTLEAYHLSAHLRPVLPELERITEILSRRSLSQTPTPTKPQMNLTFPRELTMPEIWAQMERAYLLEALQRHAWNLTHTAEAIGKSLPKLRELLKKYELRKGR